MYIFYASSLQPKNDKKTELHRNIGVYSLVN